MTDKPKKPKPVKHEVVFHTYPKLIFVWPMIVVGFVLWPFTAPTGGGLEVFGWVYLLLSAVVIMTISVDIERNHAVFWLVVFGLFFFLGRWLQDAKGFYFFNNIYNFFANLDVTYNRGFGLAMSILLAVPYAVMLLWSRLQHKWRITHNEFEHYAWGRADDSLARGAKRVRSTYPDLLELLIFGAGTLIVYSATGRTELRRIPHVPLIFLVRKRINRLMEITAVTDMREKDLMEAEEAETEEAETGPPSEREDESEGVGSERDPL